MERKSLPLMGFCPIGKFVFSHEDAVNYKNQIETKLECLELNYIGIDSIIPDGIIRDIKDVAKIVEFFSMKKIDCLFLPHCNFGTESVVGLIGDRLHVPTLIWGPRDEAPLKDGTRLRDSLCGMFASTKVLNTFNVPFSYIENCRIDDHYFEEGVVNFVRSVNVVKKLHRSKIGLVGNRIDFFWSTIINENELLHKFGIEVLPFDLVKTIELVKDKASDMKSAYITEMKTLSTEIDFLEMTEEGVINILALRDVLIDFVKENRLAAIAVESFMSITEQLGAMISFAQAMVTDLGFPCITESDIHGAISSIISEAAMLNEAPSFFADLTIRHPENNNGLLLWHDSFPFSLKAPDSPAKIGTHWILPNINPGSCHWRLKDGTITIVRFDASSGSYSLIAEKVRTISGPFTQNTYVWVEFDDWKQFERRMIEGPYIHHVACVYGDVVKVLEDACKFIKELSFDKLD